MTTRRLGSALMVLSLSAWGGNAAGTFDISRSDNVRATWLHRGSSELTVPFFADRCVSSSYTIDVHRTDKVTSYWGQSDHTLPNSKLSDLCKVRFCRPRPQALCTDLVSRTTTSPSFPWPS